MVPKWSPHPSFWDLLGSSWDEFFHLFCSRPQSAHKAHQKHPKSIPKAPPKHPQSIPKAPPKHPKSTSRAPQKHIIQNTPHTSPKIFKIYIKLPHSHQNFKKKDYRKLSHSTIPPTPYYRRIINY